ncbi:hypothetical protein MBOVJF4428_00219 [Mycoplasmopsis agalactiae]|uniref:hypothetical protein n=1 Tax=Mycoplasmopsis agalactiae TaxID=2110 RepID=UPI000C7079ED|nr:hypothetical protein [Mycoplasmopsis agalactiae]MCE6057157.1 hypothetical protein [Mycoplasmopsis agalactiae]MCE6078944.1 hypothetical protein [Mycoplasmopsis agalactiae]MCE6095329.1 hypothetical protein [Mycoplasmopsis agalactiae]MCE6114585.1 hypothetical protein [Mycoplasmopsis agalactiae]NLS34576.1 hypothetical protein [Mycoplasmopsis agalactiae]
MQLETNEIRSQLRQIQKELKILKDKIELTKKPYAFGFATFKNSVIALYDKILLFLVSKPFIGSLNYCKKKYSHILEINNKNKFLVPNE